MLLIDFIIMISFFFAAFFGLKLVSGKLKNSFSFIFAGIGLMALNYILDALSMSTGNMELMLFFHLDIFWVTNAAAFVIITTGFYKMHNLFKKLGGGLSKR